MSETMILRIKDLPVHARGDGVETTLIAGKDVCGSRITTGLTSFPPGKEGPVHKHNCDEQVTLIEGKAAVEIEGERSEVNVMDTIYIKAGTWHRFLNVGDDRMTTSWVYDTDEVTRTFQETGKTVEQLSGRDVVTKT
jgi:quercetin dioxygenase-like cupin family protein